MKYCDTQLDNSTQDLFDRLEFELRGVDTIRLLDTAWLTRQDFRDWLDPILTSVRARGGQVTHSSETAKNLD
jgi:hypothetical protein